MALNGSTPQTAYPPNRVTIYFVTIAQLATKLRKNTSNTTLLAVVEGASLLIALSCVLNAAARHSPFGCLSSCCCFHQAANVADSV
jgi:hypothetical protein